MSEIISHSEHPEAFSERSFVEDANAIVANGIHTQRPLGREVHFPGEVVLAPEISFTSESAKRTGSQALRSASISDRLL